MKRYVSSKSLLQLLHQVDDLRLDRDVERRDGLVADEEVRVERERTREPDPLPLPARELVWIPRRRVRREPDGLEQLAHLVSEPLATATVDAQRLTDDASD